MILPPQYGVKYILRIKNTVQIQKTKQKTNHFEEEQRKTYNRERERRQINMIFITFS